jgi:hypothetical protein
MSRYIFSLSLAVFASFAMSPFLSSSALAATAANSQSALGMNLQGVTYYSEEQPFGIEGKSRISDVQNRRQW